MSIKGQGHSLTLVKDHSDFKVKMFKLLPWVDLDTFYAKVKFGDIGFCMRKSENYLFFLETVAALGLKVA